MIDVERLFLSPLDICNTVAENITKQRKARKLSQKKLAEKSGVSYASLRRFEETGMISLEGLVKIARVMDLDNEIINLFTRKYYHSIQDIIDEQNKQH